MSEPGKYGYGECAYRRCKKRFEKKRKWQKHCCPSHRTQEYKARVRDKQIAELEQETLRRVEQAVARLRKESEE